MTYNVSLALFHRCAVPTHKEQRGPPQRSLVGRQAHEPLLSPPAQTRRAPQTRHSSLGKRAYATVSTARLTSSRSSQNKGERSLREVRLCVRDVRGSPCGIPPTPRLTYPPSITPAFKNARMSFDTRFAEI